MPRKSTKKKTPTKKVKAPSSSSMLSTPEVQHLVDTFYQVVGDLRNENESKLFLLDFLTESERLTFAKRLAIGLELQAGKSYDAIRKEFGVSSATISSVAEMTKSAGMQLALKKSQSKDGQIA
jgi:uncharacterized protein YerC